MMESPDQARDDSLAAAYLRLAWVKRLRQPYQVEFTKVPGTDNPADLFTKIQAVPAFKQCQSVLMQKMG